MPSTLPRRKQFAKLRLTMCASFALTAPTILEQTPELPGNPPPPRPGQYVLHAYTDLLQIPTLVLDRFGAPLGNLDTGNFQIQIDSGPPFHPVALQAEGGDPISLAILLDTSGAQSDLISAFSGTPGHGVPVTLLPEDTVSVYAFDCRIFRSALDVPASDPALAESVTNVLASPRLHNPGGKTCADRKHLWDAMAVASRDLASQPGRRVILVISQGEDNGSAEKWSDLRDFTAYHSITIFGLFDPADAERSLPVSSPFLREAHSFHEDLLTDLVGKTGGIPILSKKEQLGGTLEHIIALVRSRYILQFPRPQMPGGEHHLDVHTTDRHASVHIAGISVPVRDEALWKDPSTVPADTSKLPVAGKRKPLKP